MKKKTREFLRELWAQKQKEAKEKFFGKLNRRDLLQMTATGLVGGTLANPLKAQTSETPHRLLVIFLQGAWDSALATDPIVGSKASSSTYASQYGNYSTSTVSGKSNLVIGNGMANAATAMSQVNTAFVNGMFVEVTAHELAVNFMHSGVSSLSRSREYPALAALLGEAKGGFPPHMVLGGIIPLAGTKTTSPPLQAQNFTAMQLMLRGPSDEWVPQAQIDSAHSIISQLDSIHTGTLSTSARQKLATWFNAQSGINDIYTNDYSSQFELTDEIKSKYNFSNNWDQAAVIPGALFTLQSGLSKHATVVMNGYDTHTGHFGSHVSLMSDFATRLNTLVQDLRNTPDPDVASLSLMDTTTILVTSEFVRTPHLNQNAGTDHWQSGSAILMGKGVVDNQVIGATGDDAMPLGWTDGGSTTFSTDTQILPGDVVATILEAFGENDVANNITTKRLANLIRSS